MQTFKTVTKITETLVSVYYPSTISLTVESNNVELWTFLQEVLFHVHFLIISLLVPIGIWLFAGLPLKVFAHVIGLCIIKLQFLSSNNTLDLLNELIYCKKILFCPYKIYLMLLMYFIWMWWLLYTVFSSKGFLKAFCRHALIEEFLQLGLEHLGASVMWLQ